MGLTVQFWLMGSQGQAKLTLSLGQTNTHNLKQEGLVFRLLIFLSKKRREFGSKIRLKFHTNLVSLKFTTRM